jgi:cysteine desulfurase
MSDRLVYLDNSATTPVDPRVVDKMVPWLYERFGNPASNSHALGWDAEEAVEHARAQVAQLVNADPREIIWTSGATESDNLALKGAAAHYASRGRHIVTVATEHKAVLDTCHELERRGFEVTFLDVGPDGLVDLDAFRQATGKVDIDLQALDVDLMSFSAHKTYGPKGVGALYVRRKPRVRLEAQIHGGGHERGLRSGTLATHQIVGMGEAFELARLGMAQENERIRGLRDRLWAGLSKLDDICLNGDMTHRVAHNLNVSFSYIEGEALIMGLKGLAVSSGSACTSASLEPSYVLRALGRRDELAHSSIRFTLGRFTTSEDIDYAVREVTRQVNRLREMSPLWEMARQGIDVDAVTWPAH